MRHSMTVTCAAAAGALAVAGCGAAAKAGNGGTSAASASGKTVSVKQFPSAGRALADSRGRALYSPDQEANGKVLCTGACTSVWVLRTPALASDCRFWSAGA